MYEMKETESLWIAAEWPLFYAKKSSKWDFKAVWAIMANDIVIDNAVYNQWSQKDVSCIVCFGRSIYYKAI